MKKYFLLDTQALSSLTHKSAEGREKIRAKIRSLGKEDNICASIVSLYEMEYGVSHADNEEMKKIARRAIHFVRNSKHIVMVPLSERGAEIFGVLKEQYRQHKSLGKKALVKHNVDLIIAATALDFGALLVSGDGIFKEICEFREDFKWENWAQ